MRWSLQRSRMSGTEFGHYPRDEDEAEAVDEKLVPGIHPGAPSSVLGGSRISPNAEFSKMFVFVEQLFFVPDSRS